MTKQEIIKLIILIESVYSNFITKSETVIHWFEFCGEIDYYNVMKNLSCHIRSNPYPPTMTDLTRITVSKNDYPQSWMDLAEQDMIIGRLVPAWIEEYTLRNSTHL
jgi:hypothetical protein